MAAEGFALPGAPGIIIGHNDRIAWGFTNDYADVQDLYAETFKPANPLQYQVNGQWVAAEVRHEIIHVKGKDDETMDVVVTRHGPVLENDANTGYALKWTATEPGGLNHAYFGLATAQNWQEFRERRRTGAERRLRRRGWTHRLHRGGAHSCAPLRQVAARRIIASVDDAMRLRAHAG